MWCARVAAARRRIYFNPMKVLEYAGTTMHACMSSSMLHMHMHTHTAHANYRSHGRCRAFPRERRR